MAELRENFLAAARSLMGKPFRHHYEPDNPCSHGAETLDVCMERGLNPKGGLDCSGFVIVSMCLVQGIQPADWPRGYRHLTQLKRGLAKEGRVQIADVVLTDNEPGFGPTHMGVVSALGYMLHAGDKDHFVCRGRYSTNRGIVEHINLEDLAQVPAMATSGK